MSIQTTPPSVPKGRVQLSQVLRGAGEAVSVDDVSGILRIERQAASKLFARWSGLDEAAAPRFLCPGADRGARPGTGARRPLGDRARTVRPCLHWRLVRC